MCSDQKANALIACFFLGFRAHIFASRNVDVSLHLLSLSLSLSLSYASSSSFSSSSSFFSSSSSLLLLRLLLYFLAHLYAAQKGEKFFIIFACLCVQSIHLPHTSTSDVKLNFQSLIIFSKKSKNIG